jgi:hypothetical protein
VVLRMPHRERHLQVFIGMEAVRVLEVAIAQSPGFAEQRDDFILRRNQVHMAAFV